MIPNPVGVLKIAAVLHQCRETRLRDHIAADEFVSAEAFGIAEHRLGRIGCKNCLMALVLKPDGETESGVVRRCDHEAHL
jgi:hypothetical protein